MKNKFTKLFLIGLLLPSVNLFSLDPEQRTFENRDGLYYVLEKINNNNYESWKNFVSCQASLCYKKDTNGINRCENSLKEFQDKLATELDKPEPSAATIKNSQECIRLYESHITMSAYKTASAMNDCLTRQGVMF